MLYKVKYMFFESDHISSFFIECCCFLHATEKAHAHLEDILEDSEGWDIISIKAILNFVEDEPEVLSDPNKGHCHECNANYEGKGSCPFCSAKNCDPKFLMKIECEKCKTNFEVLNNDWISLFCPNCGEKVEKTEVFKKKHQ